MKIYCFIIVLLCAANHIVLGQQQSSITYLFIGSYTNDKPAKGIYIYSIDMGTGALTKVNSAHNITNPSYLTLSPDGSRLYACTETRMLNEGSVSAFSFDSVLGAVTFINKQSSGGENPVYLAVHKSNKWLVNGNYTGGSLSVYPIEGDGSIGVSNQLFQFKDSSIDPERQATAHIHSTVFSPFQDYLFAPDMGADKIRVYAFDALKKQPLEPAAVPFVSTTAGSGPRHFTFHPSGRFAYCVEELSGMISAYTYKEGALHAIQRTASYGSKQEQYSSADIHISPDGWFLYASNREEEHTISIFSIDEAGQLALVGRQPTRGRHPRNFVIDPTGKYLLVANQMGNNVVVFSRNALTGLLTYTGYTIKIPHPSCLQIRTYGK